MKMNKLFFAAAGYALVLTAPAADASDFSTEIPQEIKEQARQAAPAPGAREYDRLMRLLANLEELRGRGQIASINETLARPRGFVARFDRGGCDYKAAGLCFAPVIEFHSVGAYHLKDLVKYHRQTIASLEKANAASQSFLRILKEESSNSIYGPEVRETLRELASEMESTSELRNAATEHYLAVHKLHAETFERTRTTSGDVSLGDPKEYAEIMGKTSAVLQYQLDVSGPALERVRRYQAPNGTVIFFDRSALDTALNDPCNSLMLIFGQPGSRAAEVHAEALIIAEAWNKAFLITDASILTPEEKRDWYLGDGNYVLLTRHSPTRPIKKSWVSDFDRPGLMPPSARLITAAWGKADCGEQCRGK